MFKSLVAISNKQNEIHSESKQNTIEHNSQNIDVLKLLNEIKDDDSTENIVVSNVVPKHVSFGSDLVGIEIKNQIPIEDTKETQLLNQIKSLHCLFTWNLKLQKTQDIITHIKNKYGYYNLDISVSEFTFVR